MALGGRELHGEVGHMFARDRLRKGPIANGGDGVRSLFGEAAREEMQLECEHSSAHVGFCGRWEDGGGDIRSGAFCRDRRCVCGLRIHL